MKRPDSFYEQVVERIRNGNTMSCIAREMGITPSTLCLNLQLRKHLNYRDAQINRYRLAIEQSSSKLAQAHTKEEAAAALRALKLAQHNASKYAPEVFGEYQRVRSRNKWGHTGIGGSSSAVQGIELASQAIENTAEDCNTTSEMPPDMPPHEQG